MLTVAYEDNFAEAEGGDRGALGEVAGHVEDFADVLDAARAGAGGHDLGWWLPVGWPCGERVDGRGVWAGGDVV